MAKRKGSIITLEDLRRMTLAESKKPKPTRADVARRLYKQSQGKGGKAAKIDRMFRTKL